MEETIIKRTHCNQLFFIILIIIIIHHRSSSSIILAVLWYWVGSGSNGPFSRARVPELRVDRGLVRYGVVLPCSCITCIDQTNNKTSSFFNYGATGFKPAQKKSIVFSMPSRWSSPSDLFITLSTCDATSDIIVSKKRFA